MGNLPDALLNRLRDELANLSTNPVLSQIVQPRDQVISRFQPLFSYPQLSSLSESDFRDFLHFEHNHHWTGLQRSASSLCSDMGKLRRELGALLDESRPVATRLDQAVGKIKGLGKATMTAILHIRHPDKYGVWNNTSDSGMTTLGIYPEFERGESFGRRYVRINEILNDLARQLKTDLWTLDALWWQVRSEEASANIQSATSSTARLSSVDTQQFFLERHLHLFIKDNWKSLPSLQTDWSIYTTDEDDEGTPAGYEFPCAVGRIDILAKHKSKPSWLIIEVKRGRTGDATIGQLLRYMGWVKHHLGQPDDEVHGLIIAKDIDAELTYAASVIPNVTAQTYQIEFKLDSPPALSPRSQES